MKLDKCNICLCYFIHKVKILIHSSQKWPAFTIIRIQLIFTDTQAHFLLEIDKIWCEASLKKKTGSGSYLVTHGPSSCRKLTKFDMRLAKCNIYLCYFLHKVNILTHSCHKWPVCPVIWYMGSSVNYSLDPGLAAHFDMKELKFCQFLTSYGPVRQ